MLDVGILPPAPVKNLTADSFLDLGEGEDAVN